MALDKTTSGIRKITQSIIVTQCRVSTVPVET